MFCTWTTMGAGGWLMMGGLWLALIVLVVWVVTVAVPNGRSPARRGVDAFTVLDERLARGEIDPEEHRRLRASLEKAR